MSVRCGPDVAISCRRPPRCSLFHHIVQLSLIIVIAHSSSLTWDHFTQFPLVWTTHATVTRCASVQLRSLLTRREADKPVVAATIRSLVFGPPCLTDVGDQYPARRRTPKWFFPNDKTVRTIPSRWSDSIKKETVNLSLLPRHWSQIRTKPALCSPKAVRFPPNLLSLGLTHSLSPLSSSSRISLVSPCLARRESSHYARHIATFRQVESPNLTTLCIPTPFRISVSRLPSLLQRLSLSQYPSRQPDHGCGFLCLSNSPSCPPPPRQKNHRRVEIKCQNYQQSPTLFRS